MADGEFRHFQFSVTVGVSWWQCDLVVQAVHEEHKGCDTLYIGDIRQGQSVSNRFFVHDRGDMTVHVSDVRAELTGDRDVTDGPRVSARSTRILSEREARRSVSRVPVRPGDYEVAVDILVDNNCRVGKLNGRVFVYTNLPGDDGCLTIPIRGRIIGDVEAKPTALWVSSMHQPVEVHLKSSSGRSVEVLETRVTGDIMMKTMNMREIGPAEVTCNIWLDRGKSEPASASLHGEIVFEIKHAGALKVPVLVYLGPRS
jgi:hypothetical protein